MSKQIDKAFVKTFDDDVKHAYQGKKRRLDDIAYTKNNVDGESVQFQYMGDVVAEEHSPQSQYTLADTPHDNSTADLVDWRVSDFTDIFDDAKAKIDERQELAKAFGYALARRQDQVVYDTIDSGTHYSGDFVIPDSKGPSGFNTTKIREAKFRMDENDVDPDDRYMIVSPASMRQLLGTTAATSADYSTVKSLVEGDLDTWLGFEFRTLPTGRDEGGLTVDTGTHYNYAVHGRSLGIANGLGPRTMVDWDHQHVSWLTQSLLSIGGTIIDTEGLYRIETDGSATVSQGTDA